MTLEELGLVRDDSGKSPAWYFKGKDKLIDARVLAALKAASPARPGSAVRICLHAGPADAAQSMIIALRAGSPPKPHRHATREETYHMIEGRLELRFFDDAGRQTASFELGGPGTGLPLVYRMSAGVWHVTEPKTELALFHESRTGPFDPADTGILGEPAP